MIRNHRLSQMLMRVVGLRIILGIIISLMAALCIACGSEPERADHGFPSEIDTTALAATAFAFQVQSIESMEDSGTPIDPPRALPTFSLTDHDGQAFGSDDLRGKNVLISFAYTHCPDVCPVLFANFLEVQRQMDKRIGDDLELVIITVDPERDTPEWLSKRTVEMGGRWHYLGGSREAIEEVWADFGVRVEKQGDFVGHTGVTYLVNTAGEMVVRYPAYATFAHFIKGIEKVTTESNG